MRMQGLQPLWNTRDRWGRSALILWVAIILAVCVHAAIKPESPSLYSLWRNTGLAWAHGDDLYPIDPDPTHGGFRYGPLYGVLFVPLSWLPLRVGAVLWRLGNAALFLAALSWWLRKAAPLRLTDRQLGVLYVCVGCLAISNLFTGQMNLLLASFALIAVTASQQQRWTLASLAIALSTLMKVYPLALGLLLILVYPRQLSWRLALMLLAMALLPFLFQEPAVVCRAYEHWFALLSTGDSHRRFLPLTMSETYRDLLQLFRLLNLPITLPMYTVVQGLVGLGCAAFCLVARLRGVPTRLVGFHVLMLASIWMTLCGPTSESRTYALLAPALAWWYTWVMGDEASGRREGPTFAALLGCLALGFQLLCAFAPVSMTALTFYQAGGLLPLSALALLLSYLLAFPRLHAVATAGERQQERPMAPPEVKAA
jgi:hypothetical protein